MFPGQPACDDNGYKVSSVGIILVSMGSYTALSLWKCLIRCALLCTPHAESGCVCFFFFYVKLASLYKLCSAYLWIPSYPLLFFFLFFSFFFFPFFIFFCGIYYYHQWDFQILSIEKRQSNLGEESVTIIGVCMSLPFSANDAISYFFFLLFFFPFTVNTSVFVQCCFCLHFFLVQSFWIFQACEWRVHGCLCTALRVLYIIIQIPPLIGLCVYIRAFACLKSVHSGWLLPRVVVLMYNLNIFAHLQVWLSCLGCLSVCLSDCHWFWLHRTKCTDQLSKHSSDLKLLLFFF